MHQYINCIKTRFIPAPAGNTCWYSGISGVITVHPRACGEHSSQSRVSITRVGSSPRLRGTPCRALHSCRILRFIPAPAGNTQTQTLHRVPRPVHPRACGEHAYRRFRYAADPGSSPRLRGTLRLPILHAPIYRFIPAPAGNTLQYRRTLAHTSVHPRACGEHRHSKSLVQETDGSSPRLRGTHLDRVSDQSYYRFIPAPAGNTNQLATHHATYFGSSPRLRGTPSIYCLEHSTKSVHPRACGEHALKFLQPSSLIGSSPRLRGTLTFERGVPAIFRFIPAPAGNTW